MAPKDSLAQFLLNLTPTQALALTKYSAVPDEFLSELVDSVPPGTYNLDFTVHIKCTLKKGLDYERTPTSNIPLLPALALMAKHAGLTRSEQAITILFDILQKSMEYSNSGDKAKELLLAETGVMEAMERIKAYAETLPKVKTRGHVSKHYLVELVDQKDVAESNPQQQRGNGGKK